MAETEVKETGLSYYMAEKKRHLEEFGDKIGVTKQIISFWAKGERSINSKYFSALEEETGVPAALLTIKNPSEVEKIKIQMYLTEDEDILRILSEEAEEAIGIEKIRKMIVCRDTDFEDLGSMIDARRTMLSHYNRFTDLLSESRNKPYIYSFLRILESIAKNDPAILHDETEEKIYSLLTSKMDAEKRRADYQRKLALLNAEYDDLFE